MFDCNLQQQINRKGINNLKTSKPKTGEILFFISVQKV